MQQSSSLPPSFSLSLVLPTCVCLRNENENQATASSQKQINALSGRQVIYLAIVRCFLLSSEFAVTASAIAAAATAAVCVWALPQHPLPRTGLNHNLNRPPKPLSQLTILNGLLCLHKLTAWSPKVNGTIFKRTPKS